MDHMTARPRHKVRSQKNGGRPKNRHCDSQQREHCGTPLQSHNDSVTKVPPCRHASGGHGHVRYTAFVNRQQAFRSADSSTHLRWTRNRMFADRCSYQCSGAPVPAGPTYAASSHRTAEPVELLMCRVLEITRFTRHGLSIMDSSHCISDKNSCASETFQKAVSIYNVTIIERLKHTADIASKSM